MMKRNELRAFVLEDDKAINHLLNIIVRRTGIENIDLAANEYEAEELLKKNPEKNYHLMIFDTDCPKKGSGPVILKKARELGYNPKLVIASSAEAGNKKLWVEESKADYFLEKPFSVSELVGIIKSHFPE